MLDRRRRRPTMIRTDFYWPRCAGADRYPWGFPILVALALVTVGLTLHSGAGGQWGLIIVDDLAQLCAAAGAAVTTAFAASRCTGRMRRGWSAISIGTGSWALGQTIWCVYELLLRRETPFPSVADVGFLVFPIGAAIGMWLFPSFDGPGARRRWLLDAGTVVTALVAVSWSTALGAIARAGGSSPFAFAVSLAYPIGDILVLTLALTGLSRRTTFRRQLLLASLAMGAMAVADSSFAYLAALDRYHTGGPTDYGWLAAFGLLAIAGVDAAHRARGTVVTEPGFDINAPALPAPATMLPYLPILLAAATVAFRRAEGNSVDIIVLVAVACAFLMVMVRQYYTVRENRTLVDALATREAQLHRQAFHDQLTGLANRAMFLARVEHALDLHRRDARQLSVLFCDLDDFKAVNDRYGHGAGDELLVRVAERLHDTVRPGDTLARLGGDEFAILLEDGGGATTLAARIIESLRAPFSLAENAVTIGSSVGITVLLANQPTPSTDGLLSEADFAMYSAKHAGKGRMASYQPGMSGPNAADLDLRRPLASAVVNGTICAAYQPIVRLDTGEPIGLEALARWTHNGVEIPAATFIPVAARSGQLDALTAHMLEESARRLARWSAQLGHHRLQVSVNIPPNLMTDHDFPARVAAVIDRHQLQPQQLVLEITEDALINDREAVEKIAHQLRDLGARLCLDDFGKGYSSLLHLHLIPLHTVKIDRDFIADIDADPAARRLAAALLRLGHDLGLEVVAEGVEREPQADTLRELGCRLAQGYLLGRPATADAIDACLSAIAGDTRAPALMPEQTPGDKRESAGPEWIATQLAP
jgi:diguanylate cyclase